MPLDATPLATVFGQEHLESLRTVAALQQQMRTPSRIFERIPAIALVPRRQQQQCGTFADVPSNPAV